MIFSDTSYILSINFHTRDCYDNDRVQFFLYKNTFYLGIDRTRPQQEYTNNSNSLRSTRIIFLHQHLTCKGNDHCHTSPEDNTGIMQHLPCLED